MAGLVAMLLLASLTFPTPTIGELDVGADTSLADSNASFWGRTARSLSGISVAGAGDVNGDGFDDILIGAYCDDEGGRNAGQTYLVLGRSEGWSMDMNLSMADASFIGEDEGDRSGRSVAGAGDVNGDGLDDILIGAYSKDEGGENIGRTYLILGKTTGWAMGTDLSTADASFIGETAGDISGVSVAGAGDVNGDGFDDILIGASVNKEGGDGAGQTYLILGRADGWARDTDLSAADASFWGERPSSFAGHSVASAGDVNGDGFDDILIGAPWDNETGPNAGQTYLVLGRASGWAMDTNLSTADASFVGEWPEDLSGHSVAGAGDVNGDGFDDILIGAYHNCDRGYISGKAYLVLGRASGWAMDTNLSTADASFLGEDVADHAGMSVAGAGDVDGDGFDDLLVGAEGYAVEGHAAGKTYLILGRAEGWAAGAILSTANASFVGEAVGDYSGGSVAGAGDVNGDGYDDILIGADGNDEGGESSGQTYLVFAHREVPQRTEVRHDDQFPIVIVIIIIVAAAVLLLVVWMRSGTRR